MWSHGDSADRRHTIDHALAPLYGVDVIAILRQRSIGQDRARAELLIGGEGISEMNGAIHAVLERTGTITAIGAEIDRFHNVDLA